MAGLTGDDLARFDDPERDEAWYRRLVDGLKTVPEVGWRGGLVVIVPISDVGGGGCKPLNSAVVRKPSVVVASQRVYTLHGLRVVLATVR